MDEFDLNSAVAVDEEGYPVSFDLSSAKPSEEKRTPDRLAAFVSNIGTVLLDPLMLKTGAPQFAVEKFYEGGERTMRGVGTATREAIQISKEFWQIPGADPAHEGIIKSFAAGFAPELFPDYPPDKLTTLGKMFNDYKKSLYDAFGEGYGKIYEVPLPEEIKSFAIA